MTAGNFLKVFRDVISLLEANGYLLPSGDFDEKKWNDIQADTQFVVALELILTKYGVVVPNKIDKIIQILPLVAALVK
jgi:hypothetical protein